MIEVINPGLFSLIVDGGRQGRGALGVPLSSALDGYAYRALTMLLKNDRLAAIEAMGPNFAVRFSAPLVCALTGARVRAFLDDDPVADWSSFPVRTGQTLRVRQILQGARYYLAFSRPLVLDEFMASFSTNLDARFGGYQGRPLAKGDIIETGEDRDVPPAFVVPSSIPDLTPPHRLRVLVGPEADHFSEEDLAGFFSADGPFRYRVSRSANRVGIRLEGGPPLTFRDGVPRSIVSEPLLPGTVQVPGDGLPIIVLYERTIGGYARAAVVCRADLPLLAHLRPGDAVSFMKISEEEARLDHEEAVGALKIQEIEGADH
ncbi:MAG TPA: biotin-dependent carboxyltransferase family protein [Syntrophales bacterium]|nr:biotin-dependent carboxyltransferase family protein [Syntrophales bacterium]HON98812.1 biotin-dependent carboxyltransferase family protein [Syntrophales bacterium]HPC00928.1 biotin-dependent carboxyltransferase family protein [Syntrophales bacterium]HRS86821.1 biotin-dependent carboxyltransferase family protein [Syntrophales bacterium]HRV42371.1 biotin-dependent carboxyltransferase family protein [Syntrophales bacterium]